MRELSCPVHTARDVHSIRLSVCTNRGGPSYDIVRVVCIQTHSQASLKWIGLKNSWQALYSYRYNVLDLL